MKFMIKNIIVALYVRIKINSNNKNKVNFNKLQITAIWSHNF